MPEVAVDVGNNVLEGVIGRDVERLEFVADATIIDEDDVGLPLGDVIGDELVVDWNANIITVVSKRNKSQIYQKILKIEEKSLKLNKEMVK